MSGPAYFNVDGVIGEYSAGPLTLVTDPNFAKQTNLFPSNRAFVPTHGCAGTKSNVVAAKGILETYSKMKGGMSKLSTHTGKNAIKQMKKSHGRRSRSHKGGASKTRRTRKHLKRSHKANKPYQKHSLRKKSRRMKRGGSSQPFNNRPISLGYAIDTTQLSPSQSALANPTPTKAYDNCAKVPRN